jgi:pre-mRNA-splicing factor CWC26
MLNEFMKQQSSEEGKKQVVEQAQYEWGTGSVQKKQFEASKQEMAELANAPFARTVDDPKLERIRKEAVRDGDPMSQYFASKREKQQEQEEAQEDVEAAERDRLREQHGNFTGSKAPTTRKKPLYNGPTPAPNRFGIRPGYRWDAVDRSNASRFEHRVMTKMNERTALKDDAYKWSVSDL